MNYRYAPVRFFQAPRRNPEYDDYYSRIQDAARGKSYPFADWFKPGEDRAYFYMKSDQINSSDQEVIDFLEEKGYEVLDYAKGIARKKGSKRTARIGKTLKNLRKNEIKQAKEERIRGKIYRLGNVINKIKKFYDEIAINFEKSGYRGFNDELTIVISQDPTDIGLMSTERQWESCMTLPTGSKSEEVYCEVRSGGLIAYLVRPGDNDIEKPIARILIRRFVNRRGDNIAVPEAAVYGAEVPGFEEAVVRWLDQKQPSVPIDIYKQMGMDYSDTFDGTYFNIEGKDPLDLLKFLREADAPQSYVTTTYLVRSNSLGRLEVCGSHSTIDEFGRETGTLDEYIDEVEGSKFSEYDDARSYAWRVNAMANQYIEECLYLLRDQFETERDDIERYMNYYGEYLDIGEALGKEDEDLTEDDIESYFDMLDRDHPMEAFTIDEIRTNNSNSVFFKIAGKVLDLPSDQLPVNLGEYLLEKSRKRFVEYRDGKLASPLNLYEMSTVVGKIATKYPGLVTIDDVIKFKLDTRVLKKIKDVAEVRRGLKRIVEAYAANYGRSPAMISTDVDGEIVGGYTPAIVFTEKVEYNMGFKMKEQITAVSLGMELIKDIITPLSQMIPPIPFLPDRNRPLEYWPGIRITYTFDRKIGQVKPDTTRTKGVYPIMADAIKRYAVLNPSEVLKVIDKAGSQLREFLFDPIQNSFDQVPEPMADDLISISNNYTERMEPWDEILTAPSVHRRKQHPPVSQMIPDMVIKVFSDTKTRTKNVVNYYKSLVDLYFDTSSNLRYGIFSLKEKGVDFLPFIEARIAKMEKDCGSLLIPELDIGGFMSEETTIREQGLEDIYLLFAEGTPGFEKQKDEKAAYFRRNHPDCIEWDDWDDRHGFIIPEKTRATLERKFSSSEREFIREVRNKYEQLLAIRHAIRYPDTPNPFDFFAYR